jgi:hypothetical protein
MLPSTLHLDLGSELEPTANPTIFSACIRVCVCEGRCAIWLCNYVWMSADCVVIISLMMQAKPVKSVNGQVCQICGDSVGVTATGDVFVACNECAFPVCRPCYEYERKEGNQCCPQCKTRYKRHKGWFLCNSFQRICHLYDNVVYGSLHLVHSVLSMKL